MTEQDRSPAREFGAILKREREMRETPLEEISKATRISKSLLEALEAGRLEALPQGVFVKGFIRAYAESIGADPAGLVNRFVELCEKPRSDARAGDEEEDKHMRESGAEERRRTGLLLAAASALALTGALLAVAFVARGGAREKSVKADAAKEISALAPAQVSKDAGIVPARRELDVAPESELSFEAAEAARVMVEWNGEVVLQRALASGESRSYPLHAPFTLSCEPGDALRLHLDGKPLPPVEGDGALTLRAAHGKMEYGYDAGPATDSGAAPAAH